MGKVKRTRKHRTIHNGKISKQPIGYCHCDAHVGYVTVELMKKHQCLEKNCPFLEKFFDHCYWDELNLKKSASKTIRNVKRAYLNGDISLSTYNKYSKWYKQGPSMFVTLMRGTAWFEEVSVCKKGGNR